MIRGYNMTDQEMIDRLKVAIEEECNKLGIDVVTGKKLLLGDKVAMSKWIESTRILLLEDESLVGDEYFQRTARALKMLSEGVKLDYS